MAALNELIHKIENPELRAQIQAAADKLVKQKKFGLVFEEHLPECTPLYDIPVKKGAKVAVIGDFAFVPRYQGAGSSLVNPTKVETVSELVGSYDLQVVGMSRGYSRSWLVGRDPMMMQYP